MLKDEKESTERRKRVILPSLFSSEIMLPGAPGTGNQVILRAGGAVGALPRDLT